jgi:hypothetical protein
MEVGIHCDYRNPMFSDMGELSPTNVTKVREGNTMGGKSKGHGEKEIMKNNERK